MLNRGGHIGTVLMVFGALALVIAALFALQNVRSDAADLRVQSRALVVDALVNHKVNLLLVRDLISRAVKENIGVDDGAFEAAFRVSLSALAAPLRSSEQSSKINNVFGKLSVGSYPPLKIDGEYYILTIADTFDKTLPVSQDGKPIIYGEITQRYSLIVRFTREGIVSFETGQDL